MQSEWGGRSKYNEINPAEFHFTEGTILRESFAWNFEFSHDSPELPAPLMQNVAYKIAWKFLSSKLIINISLHYY